MATVFGVCRVVVLAMVLVGVVFIVHGMTVVCVLVLCHEFLTLLPQALGLFDLRLLGAVALS
ncbi:hypothetical protein [Nesterenkonia pannonica]|uniref:hypothetical protein n=1 Tax=Nesterenkonia pannonica TaxID=1548602 RepID=UPI0021649440|nr:hypothetical protein [Nesterenkonia pannonica]